MLEWRVSYDLSSLLRGLMHFAVKYPSFGRCISFPTTPPSSP